MNDLITIEKMPSKIRLLHFEEPDFIDNFVEKEGYPPVLGNRSDEAEQQLIDRRIH